MNASCSQDLITAKNVRLVPLCWSKMHRLTGSVVAIITPMKDDEKKTIDYKVLLYSSTIL